MYYINKTAPLNWPVEISSPTPIRLWEKGAKPLVWAATGINALAVVAMLGRQFIDRKAKVAEQSKTTSEENHG